MASALEKELRLIRERLDSIEDALAEEMSDEDKKGRAEALREHKEAKTIPFIRKAGIEGSICRRKQRRASTARPQN
jgi:hypothetical protein